MSIAEQRQLLEYAVPMMAAWHVLNPARARKRTRSIYEPEEREEVRAHRQGVTLSDGGNEGSNPEWN